MRDMSQRTSKKAQRGETSVFERQRQEFFSKNRNMLSGKLMEYEAKGDINSAITEVDRALKVHPDDRFLSSYRDDLIRRRLVMTKRGTTVPTKEQVAATGVELPCSMRKHGEATA